MTEHTKAERIAAARRALADRYAADPEAVDRFQTRMARLGDLRRRERERVDTLVLGNKPSPPPLPKKPAGMPKAAWKAEKERLRDVLQPDPVRIREKWRGKQGTPETLEKFETDCHHRHALVKMEERGEISADQRAWAVEIAMVAEGIEADVDVRAASYEARVDNAGGDRDRVIEGIVRVRRHVAYRRWREALPNPKRMILDMIVGEQMSYNAAARRHRVGWRRAKRLLIEAIDRWPECLDYAARHVSRNDVAQFREEFYD